EASLIDFVQEAWPAIDPAEYQGCWAIDALCEHLQAVSEGQIRNLLVNFPPRCGKRMDRGANETLAAYKHRTRSRWGLIEWVTDTCERFKVNLLLIEAAGPGLSAAQDLQNRVGMKPWGIHLVRVKGDKVARALAAQATFSQLMVHAPERDWAQMVIDEMATF